MMSISFPDPGHARLPVEELRTMIDADPTFHRMVEVALGDLD